MKSLLATIQMCGLDFQNSRGMHVQILQCYYTVVPSPAEGWRPSLHSSTCSGAYAQTFYCSVPHCLIKWKVKKEIKMEVFSRR